MHGPSEPRRPATTEHGIVNSDTRVPPQRRVLWSTRSRAPTNSSAIPRSWRSPTIWKALASNGSTFPGDAYSKPSAVPSGENETLPATRVRWEPRAPSGSQHPYRHPSAKTTPHPTTRARSPTGSSTTGPNPTGRHGGVLPDGGADPSPTPSPADKAYPRRSSHRISAAQPPDTHTRTRSRVRPQSLKPFRQGERLQLYPGRAPRRTGSGWVVRFENVVSSNVGGAGWVRCDYARTKRLPSSGSYEAHAHATLIGGDSYEGEQGVQRFHPLVCDETKVNGEAIACR